MSEVTYGRSMFLILALPLVAPVFAADTSLQPPSPSFNAAPLEELSYLELEPLVPEVLKAEDEARAFEGPGPLRFARPDDVKITPFNDGTWEELEDGSRLWRLKVLVPGATDLNFGFTMFYLPPGASLHIVAEEEDYFQGPYT